MVTDADVLEWINRNLNKTQDELSPEEARWWLRLRMADEQKFYSFGIFGFVKRRKMTGQKDIPHAELVSFGAEFDLKIRLANSRRRLALCLPLFDLCGHDFLVEMGVIKPQDIAKFGPGNRNNNVKGRRLS